MDILLVSPRIPPSVEAKQGGWGRDMHLKDMTENTASSASFEREEVSRSRRCWSICKSRVLSLGMSHPRVR